MCADRPEAFFPEKGGSTREAKRICHGCEVQAECLEYALGNDERFGIWGGLSERSAAGSNAVSSDTFPTDCRRSDHIAPAAVCSGNSLFRAAPCFSGGLFPALDTPSAGSVVDGVLIDAEVWPPAGPRPRG